MKYLVFLLLLAFALPARSQDRSDFDSVDHRRSKNYMHFLNPQDPDDHRRVHTTDEQGLLGIHHRRRLAPNIVGTSIGVALLTGGIVLLNGNPPKGQNSPALLLTFCGGLTTLICGCSLVSNLVSLHLDHYSVVVCPTGVGLAYNF